MMPGPLRCEYHPRHPAKFGSLGQPRSCLLHCLLRFTAILVQEARVVALDDKSLSDMSPRETNATKVSRSHFRTDERAKQMVARGSSQM